MTVEGANQLRHELVKLAEQRTELSKLIGEAIKLGDLRENADYHTAKEKQALVQAKMVQIESKLADAEIIDVSKLPNTGRVVFGSTVTLYDVGNQQEVRYQIVGDDEADLDNGKLALSSPVARAMIGHSTDESIEVPTPRSGKHRYEIKKVEYL